MHKYQEPYYSLSMNLHRTTFLNATTVTALSILAILAVVAGASTQVFAFFAYICSTCGPHESITGDGFGAAHMQQRNSAILTHK